MGASMSAHVLQLRRTIMANENIWLCVKALAASLDGTREHGEQMLDHLENDLKQLSEDKRKDIESEMTVIIAQLSRLNMRMRE
jgi:hypothetical protein